MKVYISGQITGLTNQEYERNFRLAEKLVSWRKDFSGEIINPLNVKPLFGYRKRTITILSQAGTKYKYHWSEFYKEKWLWYMINDLRQLKKCSHIAMQSNWTESRGAHWEHYFAKFIFKIDVIYL